MKAWIPFSLLLLVLISCNANDGKEEKDVIKIDAETIHVWPGNTRTLSIVSDGTFTVTSLDPAVAQAKVENKTIIVTATGIGQTSLLLKDGSHEDLEIPVFAVINGLYTEEHNFKEYAPKFNVVADDKAVVTEITKDLSQDASNFNNARYGFEWDGRFWVALQSDLHTPLEGTFSWNGETLVLNYDGRSETYSFQGINNGPRPYMFEITLDLTDNYKELYPDAGIENVSTVRFLSAIPPFVTGK